tara:strand:- start:1017 stop:1304 length:288 start_codon:yes stop_codon:yes gene_type:complete
MNKYAQVTISDGLSSFVDQFSINDVAACYVDAADDIVIDYSNGSQFKLASGSAFVDADALAVAGVIKNAQQEKWTEILYTLPVLSQVPSVATFTF